MERYHERNRNSGSFLAFVLIIVGILWIMKKSGWDINLPGIGDIISAIGNFISNIAGWSNGVIFPILLLIAGIILITGRRLFWTLLFIIALLMFLPTFLIIPGILLLIFFPVILIIIGIILLSKLF